MTFSDSLTAPRAGVITYSDLLSRNLAQQEIKVEVISARVRGDTSTRARARFAIDVLARSPNLVIIQLGANDAAIDVWNMPPASHRRVSKSEYDSNLRYFVRNLREQSMRRYTHDAKSVGLAPRGSEVSTTILGTMFRAIMDSTLCWTSTLRLCATLHPANASR